MTRATPQYFEDLVVGRVHQTPGLTLTRGHVIQFLGSSGDWPDTAEDDRRIPDLLPLCVSSGLGFRLSPPLAECVFSSNWGLSTREIGTPPRPEGRGFRAGRVL